MESTDKKHVSNGSLAVKFNGMILFTYVTGSGLWIAIEGRIMSDNVVEVDVVVLMLVVDVDVVLVLVIEVEVVDELVVDVVVGDVEDSSIVNVRADHSGLLNSM